MSLADPPNPDPGSVRSVERAIDLLEALERTGYPTGVSELARSTSVPKATAQRLLSVLERRGFVQKEQARYQLGAGAVGLARAFLSGNSLTKAALPILEELTLLSGETTSMYMRQAFDRVVVQRVESAHPLRYTIRIGQRLPLHVGASGQVLAATMNQVELTQLLDEIGEIRLATGQSLGRDELVAKLDRVRQQGYAVSLEEREVGVVSVAAPVVRPGRGTIAAISVTGPPTRMTPEKIEYLTVEVRRAAREIGGSYSHL